jgi:hypothetical protein
MMPSFPKYDPMETCPVMNLVLFKRAKGCNGGTDEFH